MDAAAGEVLRLSRLRLAADADTPLHEPDGAVLWPGVRTVSRSWIGQHPTEEAAAWIEGFGSLYFEHLPQLESPWLTIYVDGGHPLAHAVEVLKAALDLDDDEIEWVQTTVSPLPKRVPRV